MAQAISIYNNIFSVIQRRSFHSYGSKHFYATKLNPISALLFRSLFSSCVLPSSEDVTDLSQLLFQSFCVFFVCNV